MIRSAYSAWAIGLSFVLSLAYAHGQEKGDLKERFLTEGPKGWEKFHAQAQRLQGTTSFKQILPTGEVDHEEMTQFKQAPECASFLYQSVVNQHGDKGGELDVVNPRYGFELRRKEAKKDWTVAKVHLDKKWIPVPAAARVQAIVKAPVSLSIVNEFDPSEDKGCLRIMLKEPGFTLKSIDVEARDGKELVKVHFIYMPNAKSERIPPLVTGWLLLDPSRLWTIQEDEVHLERPKLSSKVTYAAKYHYDDSRSEFPRVKRIDYHYENPRKSYKCVIQWQFDLREANLDVTDFTLSAFGFPEPVGVTWPRPVRWHIWLPLAAGASLLLCFVLLKLKRRYYGSTSTTQ